MSEIFRNNPETISKHEGEKDFNKKYAKIAVRLHVPPTFRSRATSQWLRKAAMTRLSL